MKTILVTGANRGIGLEICRQLDQLGHQLILCSRDLENGKKAADSLSDRVTIQPLDVTSLHSIKSLLERVNQNFGSLDVLINNAGVYENIIQDRNPQTDDVKKFVDTHLKSVGKIARKIVPKIRRTGLMAPKPDITWVNPDLVRLIMETNFYGVMQMTQAFIPLLKQSDSARIINISSGSGQLKNLSAESPAYSLSKAALNAMTIMFSDAFENKGISVNALCPGWVKTDMGGPNAPRSVADGADTAVWLATTDQISTGKFYRDRKVIDW